MVLQWLLQKSDELDKRLRFHDFHAHRTAGGRLDRWCDINRHTLAALLLPCIICGLMVLASPSPLRIVMAVVWALIIGVLLVLFMKRSAKKSWPVQADLLVQCAFVLLTAALIWLVGCDQYQDRGLYRHVFAAIAALLAICFIVGAALANPMFRRVHRQNLYNPPQTHYGDYLRMTELFASHGPAPDVTVGTILSSCLTILLRSPFALLTIPAIVALISPAAYLRQLTLTAFIVCFSGLLFAAVNERFGAMWVLLQAAFFKGGALLVSVTVILLGAARLAGNTYVTPIFDTTAWHTLGIMFASVYALVWWYDYWSNRLLADQIITLLEPQARGAACIPYDIHPLRVATHVPPDNRYLQVHGSGRLLAIRHNTVIKNDAGEIIYQGPVFQAHTISNFISLLALSGAPGGNENPTMAQVRSRILNFHSVLVLIFAVFLGATGYWLHEGKQDAELVVTQTDKGNLLADILNEKTLASPDETLIVVAGSGGGTRAAVYTASVLEGIAQMGKAKNIVLASGVSGGGAALAYFASNRDILEDSSKTEAWDEYFKTMKHPYIQDVLDRATEWRMAGPGRLGQLLDQSFKDHWKLRAGHQTLLEIKDMGLIFNTSLAGHVMVCKGNVDELANNEPLFRKDTKSTLAGGRLLLTNLRLPSLTQKPLEPHNSRNPLPQLPVIARGDSIRLEDAAALNANFPPVFSNAAVDIDREVRDCDKADLDCNKSALDKPTRYWITDGGAVDNRGMEMMLYALRLTLKYMPGKLPRLLIIVADASALSDTYSQNRGVSSLAGAGTHFASHLNAELFSQIEDLYKNEPAGKLQFAYVMMPDQLRESGSFGTNWMLQSRIRVRNADNSERFIITGDEMIDVLRALHAADPQEKEKKMSSDAKKVLEWSRKDCGHQDGWNKVIEKLQGKQIPSCAGE